MTRVYRYRLRPNVAGLVYLLSILDRCRDLYNGALQERRDAYKKVGKSIGFASQCRSLTEIRKDLPEYANLSRRLTVDVLKRLDLAFAAFFRRVKAGEEPGYPRFKGRDRYDSFGCDVGPGDGWSLEGKHLRIGDTRIRVSFHRAIPDNATIKGFRVRREGRHWYVCLVLNLGSAPEKVPVRNMTGIDVGITTLATLTSGEEIENHRFLGKALNKLADAQRILSLKPRRKSRRRDKAKTAVARLHRKIRDQRTARLHDVSRDLVNRYDLIAHEDLNIRGLLQKKEEGKNRKAVVGLHRSIADASWGTLIGMIAYKAVEAGTWIIPIDPRGTSSTCSRCGLRRRKALSERSHDCSCGLLMGRDHNAAVNVLDRGMRSARGMKVPFAESVLEQFDAASECR